MVVGPCTACLPVDPVTSLCNDAKIKCCGRISSSNKLKHWPVLLWVKVPHTHEVRSKTIAQGNPLNMDTDIDMTFAP